ncbi:MAG: hypothetical protein HY902_18890 [Deltaproteobacteria bacterium]|nr:hypothetical protein [Deltaproteobacteria bacterium]
MRNSVLVLACLLAACGSSAPAAAPGGDATAQAEVAPTKDAVATPDGAGAPDTTADVAADPGPLAPTAGEQEHLNLLRQARQASAQHGEKLWPGYGLHKLHLYWVHRLSPSQVRGFLLASGPVPAGAQPVAGQPDLYRLDGPGAELPNSEWDSAEFLLGEAVAVALVDEKPDLGRPQRSLRRAGNLYFDHLRFFEQTWPPPPGCGQTNHWSNDVEARALMFAENLALGAAMLADDPTEVIQRLGDFAQFRARTWELDPMILTMYDAYEQSVAVSRWVTENLAIDLGLQSTARLRTLITQQVLRANTAPMAEMTPLMADHSYWVGMALLDCARRLGWEVAPTYAKGDTVTKLVLAQQGGFKTDLLAAAKARYDWAALLQRADALGPATTPEITP